MPNIDQLFPAAGGAGAVDSGTDVPLPGGTPSASAPAPKPAPTTTNKLDQLFGASDGKEEPASSPLARSREVLPKAKEGQKTEVDPNAGAGAPTPADVQRNAEDLGGGGGPWDIENKLRRFFGAPEVGKDKKFETVLQADQPFPELPVVISGKALVKGGAQLASMAVSALTNKAAGISQASKAVIGSPIAKLSDDFFTTTRMVYQRRAEWLKDISNFVPKDWQSMAPKVDDFLEGTVKGPLTKEEQKMVTNIQLMNAKTSKMRDQIKALGYDVGPDEPGYIGSRLARQEGKSPLQTVISSAPTGKARSMTAFAQEFKPRVVHALKGQGEEGLHIIDNGNGTFAVWRNQEKVAGGRFDPAELEQGKVSFNDTKTGEKLQFEIKPSTKRAIEQHTNVQYYHDPLLSAVTANMHVSEALNAAQFLEKLKFAPELQQFRAAPNKAFPEGWRGVDMPQLKGFKFDPKVADVIDDFTLPARSGGFKALNDLSRMTVGSMFWNPLPHSFNVNAFGALEQGLLGTAAKLAHPIDEIKLMLKAHSEVMNMGQDYRAAVRAGAGLQYNAIFARDFVGKLAKQLGSDPQMSATAKAWGYANPAEMLKRIYSASSEHLWSWNDTILMHAYYARQAKGAALPAAIKEVEQTIPNYRMPSRIAGSRTAAQVWQVLPTFARYHWGILQAYGNIAQGIIAGNPGEKMKALDKLAMLAFGSTVLYPALDHAVQQVTGNENARVRRFGPFAIPDAIYRFVSGDAKYASLSSALLGVSPVFSVPTALAMGEDPFTGKKFETMKDALKFMGEQFNPIQQGMSYEGLGGRKTGPELIAEQFGIQLPSEKETDAKEAAIKRDEQRRKAREKREEEE